MSEEKDVAPDSVDVHFEPVVQLKEVELKTLEDDETEILNLRAKLYRYDKTEDPPEWKERGTGVAKILKHSERGTYRFLMRRDKTLKICGNHNIHPYMELKPNAGSNKAWVWSCNADFADEEAKSEVFAIRFANEENAQKFKEKFDVARLLAADEPDSADEDEQEKAETPKKEEKKEGESSTKQKDAGGDVTDKLNDLTIKDDSNAEKSKAREETKPIEENGATAER